MNTVDTTLPIQGPETPKPELFTNAKAAVARLQDIYTIGTEFLCDTFRTAVVGDHPGTRFRAYYPEIRLQTSSFAHVDSRLSFGHVTQPGTYVTTVTRPDLFAQFNMQ